MALFLLGLGSSAPPNPPPPSPPPPPGSVIPSDRNYTWNPGMMSVGGIPNRTTIYTTLSPSGGDDTNAIQTALNACPNNQVVKLSAGTFLLNQIQTPLFVSSSVTLRGSNAGLTIIKKNVSPANHRTGSNIAGTTLAIPAPLGSPDNCPLIIIGPSRYAQVDNHDFSTANAASSSNLISDGIAGSNSINVVNSAIFTVGRFVLLDELSGATFQPTPGGYFDQAVPGTSGVTVLMGDRMVWAKHNPDQTYIDDPYDAAGWFSRAEPPNVDINLPGVEYTDGRFTCEIKEIASISGNTITFTSPLAIDYRTSHTAQLTRYINSPAYGNSIHVKNAGVENLTVTLSGGGGIFFGCAAYSWIKNCEVDNCHGLGIAIDASFRCEVRDSYVHTSTWPVPGSDSYAICLQRGSAECLIENNIMRDYCKVLASRACGAGSVIAYNYTDDSWDYYSTGNTSLDGDYAKWQETGINASHMGGSHHVLFEGNYSHNADSDYTHGNSIYMTFFRNWLSGKRASITGPENNPHCVGGAMYSWYFSFVGNVLGRSGQMSGWVYTDSRMGCNSTGGSCVAFPTSGWNGGTTWGGTAIWEVGYDPTHWACNVDDLTLSSLIRDGNYDFLTNSQRWHTTPATFAIPNSMYLNTAPTFFGANPWPWVEPSNGAIYVLPAKKRYDDGTPNVVP